MNKDFINGFGCCFTWFVAALFGVFLWWCYPSPQPVEQGYSAEYRARLDDLIAGITPLSVADLGDME